MDYKLEQELQDSDRDTVAKRYKKFDMHCHTREGSPDAKVTLEETIEILKKKGFSGMLVTDHDSYKACRHYRQHMKKDDDFQVLYGIEYDTANAGHILIIMPTGVLLPLLEIRGLPLLWLIEIVHLYGGILGPAHPCGEKFMSIFHTRNGKKLQHKVMQKFDFVEVYNACEDKEANDAAWRLARAYGLPGFGGSDSHKADCVGLGYTLFEESIKSEDDLIAYVQERKVTAAQGAHYFNTARQKHTRTYPVLLYLFWFYNKVLMMVRTRARHLELASGQLMETLQEQITRPIRHYITLSKDE